MGYAYRCTPEMATFIWNMMIDQLTLVLRWEELRYNSLTRSVKTTMLPKHSRNFTWLTQGRSRKCWFLLNWCKVCWKWILVPWLKKQAHTLSKLWRRERRRTRIARRMHMKEVREDREDRGPAWTWIVFDNVLAWSVPSSSGMENVWVVKPCNWESSRPWISSLRTSSFLLWSITRSW